MDIETRQSREVLFYRTIERYRKEKKTLVFNKPIQFRDLIFYLNQGIKVEVRT